MYIRYDKTGAIQEVHNEDAIRSLMCDSRYTLADTREALTPACETAEPAAETPAGEPVGTAEETPAAPADTTPETTQKAPAKKKPDYSVMTVKELREAAKAAGIVGYRAMDKVTLAAVLEMH